ncbi:AAA family ATPase [Pseudotabrizicola formosa]|uniref:AAA family ATPase n=1 Tax=Pseudotabrizicola formosa TaxID=2030009 RepID=UPI000CD0C7A8|nr:AAA family ATPase [Pseudotabrizicola formosa]
MKNHHDAPLAQNLFLGKPLLSVSKFRPEINRPYLAKNLLLEGQVSLLVGPPNIGKSSVVCALAASISMGRALGKIAVKPGMILYVAGEDREGVAERAYGFFQTHAARIADFEVHGSPVNLTDEAEMRRFAGEAAILARKRRAERLLIVFDTLNLCIGDGDENSSRDMSRAIGHAQRLARMTRAHVLLVHHTSLADNGRPRGSSAMHGNIDTMLVLRKVDGQGDSSFVLLTQEKQRSVPKGEPILFEIGSFFIGVDDDGDRRTVPIALPAEMTSSLLTKVSESVKPGGEGEARVKELSRVLLALRAKNPAAFHEARTLCGMVGEGFEGVRSNSDSLRKAVRRALDALIGAGKAETDGSGGYRAANSASPQPASEDKTLH